MLCFVFLQDQPVPPSVWEEDATYGVCQHSYCLSTILVKNKAGNGVPIAWMISQSDCEASTRKFLEETAVAFGSWPAVIVIDKSPSSIAAIESIQHKQKMKKLARVVDYVICQFHVVQAMKRW
jgi:transposase-like protein